MKVISSLKNGGGGEGSEGRLLGMVERSWDLSLECLNLLLISCVTSHKSLTFLSFIFQGFLNGVITIIIILLTSQRC